MAVGIFHAAPVVAKERPNVIVILTDDQGWGDVSFNGNRNLDTPNMDSLAREGASLERFYVCPVCAPTRAEFLTGRYHPRGGVRGVTTGAERLDLGEKTIADYFVSAGYRTAAFGKWHNGMQYPYHPMGRGFEAFYGYCSGHWGDYFSPQLERNGELVQGNGYLVDDFTSRAIEFIESHADENFFAYLPMPTPHAPMQVPDRYWERMKGKELEQRARAGEEEDLEFTRAALAMVECIDHNIGRVLRKLEELQLAEETIVVFFCDNGPNSYRWNGGMKGRKGSTDEGGVRSPLFIRWPGKIPAGHVVPDIAGAIDLMPTLCDLADIPLVANRALDGVSLKSSLMKQESSSPERMIFSHWNNRVSVRTPQYRLDHRGQLFDMRSDPGQTEPINDLQPEVAASLAAAVEKWRFEMSLPLSPDERPFLVGHPDFKWTQLPARDGQPQGNIQRSASAPNCSYFTDWISTEDEMIWDVEVVADGEFEIEMHYACKPSSVGSQIQLSLLGQHASATIKEANDPPAIGAEHDRVERKTQSFMKDFKPLKFGPVHVPAGQGQLRLRALKKKGEDPLEMRLLMFRRLE